MWRKQNNETHASERIAARTAWCVVGWLRIRRPHTYSISARGRYSIRRATHAGRFAGGLLLTLHDMLQPWVGLQRKGKCGIQHRMSRYVVYVCIGMVAFVLTFTLSLFDS
jgi:hypothetical protein